MSFSETTFTCILTVSFSQISRDDLLLVILLGACTTDLLDLLGLEQLLDLIQDTFLAEFCVFLFSLFH